MTCHIDQEASSVNQIIGQFIAYNAIGVQKTYLCARQALCLHYRGPISTRRACIVRGLSVKLPINTLYIELPRTDRPAMHGVSVGQWTLISDYFQNRFFE